MILRTLGKLVSSVSRFKFFRSAKAAEKAASMAETATVATKVSARTIGRTVWNVADKGLTVYAGYDLIYNLTHSEGADADKSKVLLMYEQITNDIINDVVATALMVDTNDTRVVSDTFKILGAANMTDDFSPKTMRALSYACLGEYLDDFPSSTKFAPDEIGKILAADTVELFRFLGVKPGAEEANELLQTIADFDFNNCPVEVLRKYDFQCYVLEELLSSFDNFESSEPNRSRIDTKEKKSLDFTGDTLD